MRLEGQVAVVTGGARGIGLAITRELAAAGARVAILSRSGDELEQAAAETGSLAVRGDVLDRESVGSALERIHGELGPVDLLVNNAGAHGAIGPLVDADPDEWWRDLETSVRGSFHCIRAVLPDMLGRRSGRIVNVSSYIVLRPAPYQSAYAAGKAALLSLTESLSSELDGTGLWVFAISPGFVRTSMTERIRASGWVPGAGAGGAVPAERAAQLVAFLASGAGDGLHGRFIHAPHDWEDLARRADELARDDLYVMRLRR
jgi:NAD(P)-dependent dehydrogenase (short-subunit alcohol dehydrogenase family)